jgi:hypothetical protein
MPLSIMLLFIITPASLAAGMVTLVFAEARR